jgi:trehalose-6-phosphate synthase
MMWLYALKGTNKSDHTKNMTHKLNSYKRLCSRKRREQKKTTILLPSLTTYIYL